MESLRMLEDAALQSRIDRLKWDEQDLAERVGKQRARLESENRWNASDPLYQRLFFIHARIRKDLRSSELEVARRAKNRAARLCDKQNTRRAGPTRNVARLFGNPRESGSTRDTIGHLLMPRKQESC